MLCKQFFQDSITPTLVLTFQANALTRLHTPTSKLKWTMPLSSLWNKCHLCISLQELVECNTGYIPLQMWNTCLTALPVFACLISHYLSFLRTVLLHWAPTTSINAHAIGVMDQMLLWQVKESAFLEEFWTCSALPLFVYVEKTIIKLLI